KSAARAGSVQQPGQFLTEPAQDADARGPDRPRRHAEVGSDLGGRPAEDAVLPERLPGRGLEIGPEDGQGPADQEPAVLLLPERVPGVVGQRVEEALAGLDRYGLSGALA